VGVIWALGRLMSNGEPGFHEVYNKLHLKNITFLKTPQQNAEASASAAAASSITSANAQASSNPDADEDATSLTSTADLKCLPFVIPTEQDKL
jgi:hypothetical protein